MNDDFLAHYLLHISFSFSYLCIRQGMITLSEPPSSTSHLDISHPSIFQSLGSHQILHVKFDFMRNIYYL